MHKVRAVHCIAMVKYILIDRWSNIISAHGIATSAFFCSFCTVGNYVAAGYVARITLLSAFANGT